MTADVVKIVDVDATNIDSEDVVCVRGAQNKEGIDLKKDWLKERFKEGLKFKKLVINGRSWGFIEYLPAESAWRPIRAPGYILIDCIWVIGRHKNKGYGKLLLDECIRDAQSKNGVCAVVGDKPGVPKKGLFLKNGFEVCDTAPPYYELVVKKLRDAASPSFAGNVEKLRIGDEEGVTVFYSDQCPYTARFIPEMMAGAEELGIPIKLIEITDAAQAREMPFAYGTCGVFYRGKFLTHEILTKKGFVKLLSP